MLAPLKHGRFSSGQSERARVRQRHGSCSDATSVPFGSMWRHAYVPVASLGSSTLGEGGRVYALRARGPRDAAAWHAGRAFPVEVLYKPARYLSLRARRDGCGTADGALCRALALGLRCAKAFKQQSKLPLRGSNSGSPCGDPFGWRPVGSRIRLCSARSDCVWSGPRNEARETCGLPSVSHTLPLRQRRPVVGLAPPASSVL